MKSFLEIINEKKSDDNDSWLYKLDMDVQTLKDTVERLEKKIFELEKKLENQ